MSMTFTPTRRLPLGLGPLALAIALTILAAANPAHAQERMLPEHLTPAAQRSIKSGLQYLKKTQASNGSWQGNKDGSTYPVTMTALASMAFLAHGDTTSRGKYAPVLDKAIRYLMRQSRADGLIVVGGGNGRPMYGHGFALLALSTAYGMETDPRIRRRMKVVIDKAIGLTARAQSGYGGWTYTPGGGDEGSVTITQMQALRSAHNAGFTVPKGTIEQAVKYLENCQMPDGGICYSYSSRGSSRPAISAAAITCLYSAGDYDSDMAKACLKYVFNRFQANPNRFNKSFGHDFYAHYYAAQAFYQAGDKYWNSYFPAARDQLINKQSSSGAWSDGVGPTYATAMACTILQLPYKYLPIYQR